MAKTVVNPAAELPPRAGDILLELDQLSRLVIFATIKKAPSFAKFPGSYVLRHYHAGEAICHQGQPGQSAFYMLTTAGLRAVSGLDAVEGSEEGTNAAVGADDPKLEPLRVLARSLPSADDGQPVRLATARLLGSSTSGQKEDRHGFWAGVSRLWSKGDRAQPIAPQAIPNDGPADIDYESREAAIYSGEVFGEMSCLSRQPRSATVVADQECFVLEILRNVLDQMRKDKEYKKQSEQKYRDRVMEGHLRQLSLFGLLSPEEFRKIAPRVELVDFAPGKVIWDEGDAADAIYVVRSGIVQVVQSFPWQMTRKAVTNWKLLAEELVLAGREDQSELHAVWTALSPEVQGMLAGELSEQQQDALVAELNALAKQNTLLLAKPLSDTLSDPRLQRETAEYGPKPKGWTDLQVRRANRILYHVLFPGAILPPDPPGIQRVLSYLGRGDTLGEIALALGQPRTATCVAYAHPGANVDTLNVELVRIPAELFRELVEMSPDVRQEIKRLVASRRQHDEQVATAPIQSLSFSSRAEQLGLLQGQKLMLIDLDRCTRCGDCVEACIDTHDDGYSRLFLDGPRYGNYLIPSSCRNCRDPVCMIGCPVGSIQQGDDGEVLIRDWCIGCGVCARQCPYDAIQMHDASVVPSHAPGWRWTIDSTMATSNWFAPALADKRWTIGAGPFKFGIEMCRQVQAAGGGRQFFFRYEFAASASLRADPGICRLLVTSAAGELQFYLNGQQLELSQDARQKKRGEYEAMIPPSELKPGSNCFAARVTGPIDLGATLLEARLDILAEEQEEVEEKLVTENAVVCDQCSSLSGNRHACVYACPHEAAMRIDAWVDFPTV